MLVSQAIDTYVTDRRARAEIGERTARQLRWRLGRLAEICAGVDMAQLGRDHIRDWQAAIGDQRPASRRAYLSTVRVFCRWAADWDLLAGDPCRSAGRVKEPHRDPRALSGGQMARLRLVLPDLEARVIVALMARQGLRCVEVSRLAVSDWDRGRGRIVVCGKNDDERRVPVADDVAALLGAYVGDAVSGPVIGRPPAALSRLVRAWMEAAGLKNDAYDGRSAHALRHTAASDLYEATRDIKAVQAFLGHRNVATTDRYLRSGDDRVIRAGLNAGRSA
ncbi:MAG TPA: tyrosine-type recombinase/integrase [Acidimicrobiales bacterium]|jgi:integrase